MVASEYDSNLLDNCRRKNDELLAENQRLREEIARLTRQREKAYRAIRDIMKGE